MRNCAKVESGKFIIILEEKHMALTWQPLLTLTICEVFWKIVLGGQKTPGSRVIPSSSIKRHQREYYYMGKTVSNGRIGFQWV